MAPSKKKTDNRSTAAQKKLKKKFEHGIQAKKKLMSAVNPESKIQPHDVDVSCLYYRMGYLKACELSLARTGEDKMVFQNVVRSLDALRILIQQHPELVQQFRYPAAITDEAGARL
jgi:hypothetical protein